MAREIIDGMEVDLDRLPGEFDELKPFIRKWAGSDDVERENVVSRASTEDLEFLWSAVQPRFTAINEYLDRHDDDDEADLLGNLAEGAMEAAFEIERRTGTSPLG
jgi:hypothetical protein